MKTLLLTLFVWLKGDELEPKKVNVDNSPNQHRRNRILAHSKNKYRDDEVERT
jgi:hypothetical protein